MHRDKHPLSATHRVAAILVRPHRRQYIFSAGFFTFHHKSLRALQVTPKSILVYGVSGVSDRHYSRNQAH